jgi:hypothetical protein
MPIRDPDPKRIRRLRCIDVARNRAGRYAKRHGRMRPFLPLISTAIFTTLLLERWPAASAFRKAVASGSGKAPPLPQTDGDRSVASAAQIWIDDDEGRPQYRPAPDFLAKNAAQVVAFLVRNGGRVDTDAVRAKWDFLDKVSLPLAVYLREVEANGTWNDLEKDVKAAPLAIPHGPNVAMPKSIWHRKILAALPDWAARGEDLMRNANAEEQPHELAPAEDQDSLDDEPPTP